MTGNVKMAIVHDAANAESKAHADELSGLIGPGLKVGKVTLEAVLIDSSSLSGIEGVKAAFVTNGLGGNASGIFSKTSSNGIVSVGDLACVDAGQCVLNVESTPTVKIYVSKAAASASSVSFSDAFRMMITEK